MSTSNLPFEIAERFPAPSTYSSCRPPRSVTLNGEKPTYVNHANTIETNVFVFSKGQDKHVPVGESTSLCHDYYNLVVFGGCTELECGPGHALMPKDRCLTEGFHRNEINERLCHLSPDDIEELKRYPALVLNENTGYRGKTDPNQIALYAIIEDIKIQDNGVMIYYQMMSPIKQIEINEIGEALGLQSGSAKTELNRTHWVLKKINLSETLFDARLIGKYY